MPFQRIKVGPVFSFGQACDAAWISDTSASAYCPQIKVFPFTAIYKTRKKKKHDHEHNRPHSVWKEGHPDFLQFHEADATCPTLFSLSHSLSPVSVASSPIKKKNK